MRQTLKAIWEFVKLLWVIRKRDRQLIVNLTEQLNETASSLDATTQAQKEKNNG